MNKIYLVIYKSEDGRNLDKIKQELLLIGTVYENVNTRKVFSAFVAPTDEKIDAVEIRNRMKRNINPFEEGAAAIEVNELDMADTDICKCLVFQRMPREHLIEEDVQRNFHRFKTRHEAFVAYEVEKPIWTYPDNIGNAIRMDIDEWLWMPINKDGRYERGKYEKYLG